MAINFWLANSFNIFISENLTQSNTSATGAVWVGQTATLVNYQVGADLPLSTSTYMQAIQVLGNMNIIGGINYTQSSGLDVLGTLTAYTMTNLNGVTVPQPFTYRPSDIYPYNYLQCSSIGWASINTGGTQALIGERLTLTGTSPTLNSFLINSSNVASSGQNISAVTSIDLVVPSGSTVIISIDGASVTLNSFVTLINGIAITLPQSAFVLWNFPEALNLSINSNIFGALLAPFATIISSSVTIYGTLITKNLSGLLNGVKNDFTGELPDLYNPSTTGTCTVATTSSTTTTTTTTTSSTTTISATTCAPKPWNQAVNDLIESIALEQAALSNILDAEGKKIQKAVSGNLTAKQLLCINKSVEDTVNMISTLQMILKAKLEISERVNCSSK